MIKIVNAILFSVIIMLLGYMLWMDLSYRGIWSELFSELKPVHVSNCDLKRFGPPNDGGYLLCQNLIDDGSVGYSYGIENRDGWGCDLSREFGIKIHQYDCFDLRRPLCEGGTFVFHEECVADKSEIIDSRPFNSIESQVFGNEDFNKPLIIKMDVEGAEIGSLAILPDNLIENIHQLVVEFHGIMEQSPGCYVLNNPDRLRDLLAVIRQLKNKFHIVNVRYPNNMCFDRRFKNVQLVTKPAIPSPIFEVLMVNKSIAKPDHSKPPLTLPDELNTLNFPELGDCH